MKISLKLGLFILPLLFAACGTSKQLQGSNTGTLGTQQTQHANAASALSYVQKVSDNKVYAQNIVADFSFTAKAGGKDVSVPGSLHMRRDQIIRLQLFVPILGTEVGRLEFTPDQVLVVDRIHKQYMKGDYSQLDFLRENGLDFYSLQALFWNQLLLPGVQKVGEGDLQQFSADLDATGDNVPVSIKHGNLTFVWNTLRATGQINEAKVTYASPSHGTSTLTWTYNDFKAVGAKRFPAFQEFSFQSTEAKKMGTVTVTLDMSDIKANDKWDTQTTLSSKYKQVDAKAVLGKLLSM